MLKKLVLIAVAVSVSACASAPGKYAVKSSRSYQKPYDEVWEDIVRWFAKNNIPIKNIAKDSGVIYAESSRFDDAVADCGQPGLDPVLGRRANFNVFVSHSGTESTVSVNTDFTEMRRHGFPAREVTLPCSSRGVLEGLVLSSVSSSGASTPSTLEVGTKLFTKAGALLGTVTEISDSKVKVSLTTGGATTVTKEQAIEMMQK